MERLETGSRLTGTTHRRSTGKIGYRSTGVTERVTVKTDKYSVLDVSHRSYQTSFRFRPCPHAPVLLRVPPQSRGCCQVLNLPFRLETSSRLRTSQGTLGVGRDHPVRHDSHSAPGSVTSYPRQGLDGSVGPGWMSE